MSTTDNLEQRLLLEQAVKVLERTANDTLDGRNAAIDIRDFLAHSPAPPPSKELSDESDKPTIATKYGITDL